MAIKLNARSEKNLVGVHPDLVKLVRRAAELCPVYFFVNEGLRTLERQKQLVIQGASKTMKSRHLTGHAVDLVPMLDLDNDGDLDVSWVKKHFEPIAVAMKQASKELGVPVEWGFDLWGWDAPHFQLPVGKYK